MNADEVLASYHRPRVRQLELSERYLYLSKPGVPHHPQVHPGVMLLAEQLAPSGYPFCDASSSAGLLAMIAARRGAVQQLSVVDPSRAVLRCAQEALQQNGVDASVIAGALWDLPLGRVAELALIPSTARGSARVQAELAGAQRALQAGGVAHMVMHKDQGAKRYEKDAKARFGEVTVIAKRGGWRLVRARKTCPDAPAVEALEFNVANMTLSAYPGVHAAGKCDPGTALLLAHTDFSALAGKCVLDLGAGYGLLALKASLAGAAVTALDDDLLAVRSSYENALRYGLDVRCLHADVDSELKPDEQFDAVLMNPPFHVGKQVVLDVPRAFLAAAQRYLIPGGSLTLVANKALAYERELEHWATLTKLAEDHRFKVLHAIKK